MKKLLLALALLLAGATAQAQTAPPAAPAPAATPAGYSELLAQTIDALLHTGDAATLAELAAKLERAAAANPTDWLPPYYQAYALVLQARLGKASVATQDQLLDRAEAALGRARQLKGDESELLTLQAFAYQMRLSLNPEQRYQEYGPQVQQAASLAKTLSPGNPRPYLILADQLYYTPEMYGGGPAKARPLYEAAQARFATFRPASPLAPNWGQDHLQHQLKAYAPATAAGGR